MTAPAQIPPLDVVRRLQAALARAGLPNVVGGSALLAALGLIDVVNDWDVVTDGDPDAVAAVLDELGLPYRQVPAKSIFRTESLFVIPVAGYTIDVMVRFAIATPSGVVAIPARPGGRWKGLRLADPRDWESAYRLMGRAEKAGLLAGYLRG